MNTAVKPMEYGSGFNNGANDILVGRIGELIKGDRRFALEMAIRAETPYTPAGDIVKTAEKFHAFLATGGAND